MLILNTEDQYVNYLIESYKGSRTIQLYRSSLRRFVSFIGNKEVEAISFEDFEAYRRHLLERGRKKSYIYTEFSALLNYLEFLKRKLSVEAVDILDIKDLRPRKLDRNLPNPLEAWEVDILKEEAVDIEDKMMITLLFHTGLRISELLSLTKENIRKTQVQQDGRTIRKTYLKIKGKGGKEREIPLSLKISEMLDKYLYYLSIKNPKGVEKLFQRGYKAAWARLKELGKKADINVHPHQLRHSFATELLSNEVDIRTVAELMGHESLNTTMIYTKVRSHLKEKAVKTLDK